jgi:hypothetical protein
MDQYLQILLAAAGITGPQLMNTQLDIMNSLGYVNPEALGITDPSKFRDILAKGGGFPTLEREAQNFRQTLYGFSEASPQRGNVPKIAS